MSAKSKAGVPVLPLLVLLGGWALSAGMYVFLHQEAMRREALFFSERVAEAEAAIRVRITHYVDALHGGTSFFAATKSFDREEWHAYTESLQLRTRYPGINGLGIILAVPPDGMEAWKARVRIAGEPEPEAKPFPGTVEGAGDETKYLITYVEGNVGDRAPIGRNIATEPSRRRAAELARDTGMPHINRRIPGSRDTQRRAGLLLYVPLYANNARRETVEDRRAALLGWVYAQVFPDVFLDGVLGPMGKVLRLHFFEAGRMNREMLLYTSEGAEGGTLPPFERVTEMMLAGESFQLGWQRGTGFPAAEKSPALWVAGSLAIATLFLAGMVTSLQSVGRRANAIAAVRTGELAASEERFRQAFEAAGIGMALVGLDGRFLRVNQSLCEIVGYSEAKLLQKRFQDITHADDLTADLALLRELIDGQRRYYQLEKRYIHHDGHTVWIALTASLIRDEAGAPLHCIAQIEDITGRKRLEGNLAGARDEALESARIKSEFLATMTDEIRLPINEVVNAARGLRDTPLTGTQAEKIRTIETAGEALLTLSNDILDYSKIEAGQIGLESVHFNLRQCVNDTLALFAQRARHKGIKLEASVAERVPSHAAADARRLQQILVNLLTNAFKLTETGEIRVSLTAEALDATTGRQRLKFAVRDTGAGMPAEQIERLFKSFSPVDAPTRQLGGTGLGVAISSRLAELMGGTMWAQSEPGKGSTFHFTVLVEPRSATKD
jgi:PAS domain S-box-containing protein